MTVPSSLRAGTEAAANTSLQKDKKTVLAGDHTGCTPRGKGACSGVSQALGTRDCTSPSGERVSSCYLLSNV